MFVLGTIIIGVKKEAQVACQLMGYFSTDLKNFGKNANVFMLI